MSKKHVYEKLRITEELHGRINLCLADPKNPHAKIATVFGNQPVDVMHAKLLCECWNAVTSVAERLGEDPLKIARRLKRGELIEA